MNESTYPSTEYTDRNENENQNENEKCYEEGDLEDCDLDHRQHSDGNRDYAGSD